MKTELLCFCDASTLAHTAVFYLRVITSEDIFVNILQAKSKVSLIETVTIPRLELCTAKLLIQLTEDIRNSLDICQIGNVFTF